MRFKVGDKVIYTKKTINTRFHGVIGEIMSVRGYNKYSINSDIVDGDIADYDVLKLVYVTKTPLYKAIYGEEDGI